MYKCIVVTIAAALGVAAASAFAAGFSSVEERMSQSEFHAAGLDKLTEAISLQAEILDLKANPDRTAEGTVIESRLDRGRGPIATVLVQKGTLRQGDIVVAGAEWGRVRAMLDDKSRPVTEAAPSSPVEVLGLAGVPSAGEPFVVVENESRSREIAEFRTRIIASPAKYIAQPTLSLSSCPTFVESGLAPRHIDIRPYVLSG